MRILNNLSGFMWGMVFAAMLALSMLPAHGDTPIDLPKEVPQTATLFYTCESGKPEIVALVVTFKDGSIVRIDSQHMHGIPEAKYVAAYGDMAPDKQSYGVGGCGTIKT